MTDERITAHHLQELTEAYLLQELTERKAEEFEEYCFARGKWPKTQLESAEDDLIEKYLRKELTPARRRRFKKYYLTTEERRKRVLRARSLLRVVCPGDSPNSTETDRNGRFLNSPWLAPKYAGILAVLILSVGFFFWTWNRVSKPRTFADINLVSVTSVRGPQDAVTPSFYTNREYRDVQHSQTKTVSLPLGVDALRISLTLPQPTPEGSTYSVHWENAKGFIKTLEIKSQDANSITVVIPADELVPGQYTLKLVGKQGETEQRTGDYFFIVE